MTQFNDYLDHFRKKCWFKCLLLRSVDQASWSTDLNKRHLNRIRGWASRRVFMLHDWFPSTTCINRQVGKNFSVTIILPPFTKSSAFLYLFIYYFSLMLQSADVGSSYNFLLSYFPTGWQRAYQQHSFLCLEPETNFPILKKCFTLFF